MRQLGFKHHRSVHSCHFHVEYQKFKGLASEAQNCRRLACTKGREVFDTIVHKSFQRFHIYILYIFYRGYFNL